VKGGEEMVTLNEEQLPSHSHTPYSDVAGGYNDPFNKLWGYSDAFPYSKSRPNGSMNKGCVGIYGKGYAHENRIPYLVVNYIIAMSGVYPSGESDPSPPYLSELRIFAFNFSPRGWARCDGQLLPVNLNQELFALLGTTYGGNGTTSFALPDLRKRVPMHVGPDMSRGATGGEDQHQLTLHEIPMHTHQAVASSDSSDTPHPENNFWASNNQYTPYGMSADKPMATVALAPAGDNSPHNNLAPYMEMNICIALQGNDPAAGEDPGDGSLLGEIRMFAGNVVPAIYTSCDGQAVQTSVYTSLFAIIGDIYGGDPGEGTFNLPDLRQRAALSAGKGDGMNTDYEVGDQGGAATVTLTEHETPGHTHLAQTSYAGSFKEPERSMWAIPGLFHPPTFYAVELGFGVLMNPICFASSGGGRAHNNLMPYMALVFCIALKGVALPAK
jgi:microcystin-dependent protein